MATLSSAQHAMVELFQKHVSAELAGDLDTTMETMTEDPHLNHVASMAGGVSRDGVRAFYRDHLVGKFFPPDVKMTSVSRTVGQDQVVEEQVISFTHTTPIDWLLPWRCAHREARGAGRGRHCRFQGREDFARAYLLGSGQRAGAGRVAQSRQSSGDRRRERPQGARSQTASAPHLTAVFSDFLGIC